MYVSLLLYLLMLAIVIASLRDRKNILKKLGYEKIELKKALPQALFYLGALLAASMIVGIIFSYTGFSDQLDDVSKTLQASDFTELLIIVLVGSFVEEIFFRGYLQKKTNILTASFIFAYFHVIYNSFPEVVGAFFLGMILGKAYEKTNGLFVPTLAHLSYNLIVLLITFTV
jgi:membrane protease YdiL (CAAX protease family)